MTEFLPTASLADRRGVDAGEDMATNTFLHLFSKIGVFKSYKEEVRTEELRDEGERNVQTHSNAKTRSSLPSLGLRVHVVFAKARETLSSVVHPQPHDDVQVTRAE